MRKIEIGGDKVVASTIQKWINELRSGKYKQSQMYLQNSFGFCCLGVACKVFIPKNDLGIDDNGFVDGDLPSQTWQPNAPYWLTEVSDDFEEKTGVALTTLNDGGQIPGFLDKTSFTFEEIADLLQAVYIEGVLDEVA